MPWLPFVPGMGRAGENACQAGVVDVLAFVEFLLCTKIILVSILGELYYSLAFHWWGNWGMGAVSDPGRSPGREEAEFRPWVITSWWAQRRMSSVASQRRCPFSEYPEGEISRGTNWGRVCLAKGELGWAIIDVSVEGEGEWGWSQGGSAGLPWEPLGCWPWVLLLPVRGFTWPVNALDASWQLGPSAKSCLEAGEGGSPEACPGGFVDVYTMEGTL